MDGHVRLVSAFVASASEVQSSSKSKAGQRSLPRLSGSKRQSLGHFATWPNSTSMSWFRGGGSNDNDQYGSSRGASPALGASSASNAAQNLGLPPRRAAPQYSSSGSGGGGYQSQSAGYAQPQYDQRQAAPPPSYGGAATGQRRQGNKFEVVGTPQDSLVLTNVRFANVHCSSWTDGVIPVLSRPDSGSASLRKTLTLQEHLMYN